MGVFHAGTVGELGRAAVAPAIAISADQLTRVFGEGVGEGETRTIVSFVKTDVLYPYRAMSPNYAATITFANLLLAFAMMLTIAGASRSIAARKVLSIDPFEIFPG